jgi:hypothetical protein
VRDAVGFHSGEHNEALKKSPALDHQHFPHFGVSPYLRVLFRAEAYSAKPKNGSDRKADNEALRDGQ